MQFSRLTKRGILLAVIPAEGRKLVEWAPILTRWAWRSLFCQLIYRRRITMPRPADRLPLPGDAAPLREWEDPETGAAMIHDPLRRTVLTRAGRSRPPGGDPGRHESIRR